MDYEKQIEKLKQAEKETAAPGCGLVNALASLLVIAVVVVVVALALSMGHPGQATQIEATAILGPTELVLAATPTLRPSSTPAAITAVLELAPATVAQTAAPTYTPWPTYTPPPTATALPTQTAAPTYTPWPTYTPPPTPLATPTAAPLAVAVDQFTTGKTELNRIMVVVVALAILSGGLLLLAFRPTDRDLRRIQKLLEMHLLAALGPAPAGRPLPEPVRTTPLAEYMKNRPAPVQNTGVTGVTGGNAPPETITVTVAPVANDDPAVLAAIWELWLEMGRPSLNALCQRYFGSKNSDRLALVRRAIRWGQAQEGGGDHGSL